MNIDYFHRQMHIEAKRLAEQVCAYCDVDPHSRLAEKVNDLEALNHPLIFSYVVSIT
jgi:hypothetical protein